MRQTRFQHTISTNLWPNLCAKTRLKQTCLTNLWSTIAQNSALRSPNTHFAYPKNCAKLCFQVARHTPFGPKVTAPALLGLFLGPEKLPFGSKAAVPVLTVSRAGTCAWAPCSTTSDGFGAYRVSCRNLLWAVCRRFCLVYGFGGDLLNFDDVIRFGAGLGNQIGELVSPSMAGLDNIPIIWHTTWSRIENC